MIENKFKKGDVLRNVQNDDVSMVINRPTFEAFDVGYTTMDWIYYMSNGSKWAESVCESAE